MNGVIYVLWQVDRSKWLTDPFITILAKRPRYAVERTVRQEVRSRVYERKLFSKRTGRLVGADRYADAIMTYALQHSMPFWYDTWTNIVSIHQLGQWAQNTQSWEDVEKKVFEEQGWTW
jgi:hypothetical protein